MPNSLEAIVSGTRLAQWEGRWYAASDFKGLAEKRFGVRPSGHGGPRKGVREFPEQISEALRAATMSRP
jgi:hypothetical protein